ncbi:cysteine desulfurase [Ethanoligenens harbinense]|uniref:cysteine desulfurase n=1 Tax=Ethanoligenens harbinense (strain DSM 18485 / JCM 12961 / CGMCC 1.5033 / YUAN-3) TaxID=663278 RepID=E6U750_ETHHY|nr:cysteine desulfurase [Ethanoligenens harbinense]ADU28120.1 cysteine desulfurase, SufS subfamily [Ethanoligenens harbinense YUAN-3]AVQ97128.1 cysteine desulfurase [Ethanoligenens harbinense YUAN-3]AYF39790.1 cysteine desulfurase [Ethanoligenens harbinense]AYF42622.1 cysteine desulfurase [Ethanoligenens harbinense]QCN93371.1 cysteine desulfurase [Ethanoligenens harbinense]
MSANKLVQAGVDLSDFPILQTKTHGKRLVYLDSAATAQKPLPVLDAVRHYYEEENANPHRGNYELSVLATERYEEARALTRAFINAKEDAEIIFTRNTTESLNLIAYSYGMHFIQEGDEIVLSIAEHHSNLIPWQQVAKARGATLKYLYLDKNGRITEEEINEKITEKTRLVAIVHVSNVLGTVNPVKEIVNKAHNVGAVAVVDLAQSIPHFPVDVQDIDADFAVFSGHKMLSPMGIGVLYGKRELLEKMPPFLFGGDMIEYVYEQEATFAPLPAKFEAGTQNVGGAVGLAAAIRYIQKVGYDRIREIDSKLVHYAFSRLRELDYITIYGDGGAGNRCGVISFNIRDAHPHDVASILDADGVAIRAGHHCAQPLLRYLGINATCRASFYFYNTPEDVDTFVESVKKVRGVLGYGSK